MQRETRKLAVRRFGRIPDFSGSGRHRSASNLTLDGVKQMPPRDVFPSANVGEINQIQEEIA